MTDNKQALTVATKIHWSKDQIRRIDLAAIEAKMTRAQFIRSLVIHVLDDDDAAHRVPS